MRITLAQVVVAITTQNKRRAHARRILTIPSIKLSNRWAWRRWRETKPIRTHPPHTADTRPALWDVRAGRKVTTDILDVFQPLRKLSSRLQSLSSQPVSSDKRRSESTYDYGVIQAQRNSLAKLIPQ